MNYEDCLVIEVGTKPEDPFEDVNKLLFPNASSEPVVVNGLEDLNHAFVL